MMDYQRNNHSKFLIIYHTIFVVKHRRPLLIQYGRWMKSAMLKIAEKSNFRIKEMETDRDHIHLMIESVPKLSPLDRSTIETRKYLSYMERISTTSKVFLERENFLE